MHYDIRLKIVKIELSGETQVAYADWQSAELPETPPPETPSVEKVTDVLNSLASDVAGQYENAIAP